ncbi:hypothetical protein KC19_1G005300 [Ceratodon purpureus]|uniref:Uncharacterized protein n=1 Tax=Ceratodon purpureus TaxID=3225 RepID=A0A8T0IZS4_CERPU|nr:hypothetical protein KC19_1G005300 [Ceratodon purpureus]
MGFLFSAILESQVALRRSMSQWDRRFSLVARPNNTCVRTIEPTRENDSWSKCLQCKDPQCIPITRASPQRLSLFKMPLRELPNFQPQSTSSLNDEKLAKRPKPQILQE